MSNKPKIYGTCPAGCLWETVHKEDFLNACAVVEVKPIFESAWHIELGKQYKICGENIADSGYKFSITFKYLDGETETAYNFTIPHDDKYADYVVFKLLEAAISEDTNILTLVYEMAGIRYTETISGTAISLLEEDYLIIENADEVYKYNDGASFTLKYDEYYNKTEVDEQITNAINEAIITTLNTEV